MHFPSTQAAVGKSGLFFMIFALFFLTPPPAANSAPPAKPIELKLATWVSTTHHLHRNVYQRYADEVGKASQGRIKITVYPSESLVKAKEMVDATWQGVTDMAMFVTDYTPGRFPLNDIIMLPFMWTGSGENVSRVVWQITQKYMLEEYKKNGVVVLTNFSSTGYQFYTTRPIRTIGDMKGLKMRTPGGYCNAALEALGMTPVSLSAADMYTALERKTITAMMHTPASARGYKIQEIVKYATIIDFIRTQCGIIANAEMWNKLPEELRKIMAGLGEQAVLWAGRSYDQEDPPAIEMMKKAGVNFFTLPPEELSKAKALSAPAREKWMRDNEAKGLPAKKMYREAEELIKKSTG